MNGNPAISLEKVRMGYHRRLALRETRHPVFEALSFDVMQGETLGIIGRNGAGKSTLLRLLAGVFQPDAGNIRRYGNRTALLSLNLGLDPQLTGIENALLSALLLGFSRERADRLLPRIIEFSELGSAIHDPVKTYSSGMRTRLGFSVAIYLQPDILLIDEVLGVGDLRFREKSTRALQEKIHSDLTVILVSHQLEQLKRLCDRVLWIDNGRLRLLGPPEEVLGKYASGDQ